MNLQATAENNTAEQETRSSWHNHASFCTSQPKKGTVLAQAFHMQQWTVQCEAWSHRQWYLNFALAGLAWGSSL